MAQPIHTSREIAYQRRDEYYDKIRALGGIITLIYNALVNGDPTPGFSLQCNNIVINDFANSSIHMRHITWGDILHYGVKNLHNYICGYHSTGVNIKKMFDSIAKNPANVDIPSMVPCILVRMYEPDLSNAFDATHIIQEMFDALMIPIMADPYRIKVVKFRDDQALYILVFLDIIDHVTKEYIFTYEDMQDFVPPIDDIIVYPLPTVDSNERLILKLVADAKTVQEQYTILEKKHNDLHQLYITVAGQLQTREQVLGLISNKVHELSYQNPRTCARRSWWC